MKEELLKELDKILPVVVRVHEEHHPELAEVAKLYALVKDGDMSAWEQLRAVTKDYTAPADACPTFEKTYRDLALLEQESK